MELEETIIKLAEYVRILNKKLDEHIIESEANNMALVTLLLEKGVFTLEEYNAQTNDLERQIRDGIKEMESFKVQEGLKQ